MPPAHRASGPPAWPTSSPLARGTHSGAVHSPSSLSPRGSTTGSSQEWSGTRARHPLFLGGVPICSQRRPRRAMARLRKLWKRLATGDPNLASGARTSASSPWRGREAPKPGARVPPRGGGRRSGSRSRRRGSGDAVKECRSSWHLDLSDQPAGELAEAEGGLKCVAHLRPFQRARTEHIICRSRL